MKILIVAKTTNFDLHGHTVEERVAQGRVSEDALSRLKRAHAEHYATLSRLEKALASAGVTYHLVSRDDDKQRADASAYDAVVTVGGDGTLLAASHYLARDMVLFGVRSSESSVGYLCCAGPDDPERLAQVIAQGREKTLRVERIAARVKQAETGLEVATAPVLNDFLFTNANPAATTRYRLHFKDQTEVHRSSGIWVATGVGSTAAILAAGGTMRPKDDHLFQFRVRELYRLSRPSPMIDGAVFDPAKEALVIENRCPAALLALDGQHGVFDLKYGDVVSFERAEPVRLVLPLGGTPFA